MIRDIFSRKQQYTSLYNRIRTSEVLIGEEKIGNCNLIALQSMTNTNTNDIEKSVEQCIRIFDEGASLVRLTAQGVKEAQALELIKKELVARGYTKPLIADIHFNPKAAIEAAKYVEKVRINPGNYVGAKTKLDYTDEEYLAEIQQIKENLLPLIQICKENNTAIRVGVNHGSLSQRVMSRYGDTPLGMVVSMMEFLKIFNEEGFQNVVCSVKSSNTRSMIYAYRLLVETMHSENCVYPIHLGVTEAGAGEDGRIKSAVGIGSLLLDGIGDTIRVSLTEAPEVEIPVCKDIVAYRNEVFANNSTEIDFEDVRISPYEFSKRISNAVSEIGGNFAPIVLSKKSNVGADWVIENGRLVNEITQEVFPIISFSDYNSNIDYPVVVRIKEEDIVSIKSFADDVVILLDYKGFSFTKVVRKLYASLRNTNSKPAVIAKIYYDKDFKDLQIAASIDIGSVFVDGFCDGVIIESPKVDSKQLVDLSLSILQASRARFSKTEFISCPSCGRTLFNIEKALQDVKQKTSHLKGLKIAVMGCVVNGPGEMADADYGYIGAGKGNVNLYRKQQLVLKNIKEENAVETLINIIKEDGLWVEAK